MRREYFRAVEAALYEYPAVLRQIVLQEQYLEAVYGSPNYRFSDSPAGCGRKTVAVQERIVERKEDSEYLRLLKAKAEAVERAMETMPLPLTELVELKYFRRIEDREAIARLKVSRSKFYETRAKVVEHCAPFILGPFGFRHNRK
jgi:hypothetical protein